MGGLLWYALQVVGPALPVTIQFRSAPIGSGFVLFFKNDSAQALTFTATLRHAGQKQAKKFTIQLQPRGVSELGDGPQGWVAQSGDRIWLASAKYREWRGAIP
ncbi:MAG: hypothetical protein ACREU2_17355 [Steroidobacteraceae bacterium]